MTPHLAVGIQAARFCAGAAAASRTAAARNLNFTICWILTHRTVKKSADITGEPHQLFPLQRAAAVPPYFFAAQGIMNEE